MDLEALIAELDAHLAGADAALEDGFPGDRGGRQPVHTVYVPADLFRADTVKTYGNAAAMTVVEHGGTFHELLDGDEDLVDRVLNKLETEPVEDLRIDFEDGYGIRPDDEEDEAAKATANAFAEAIAEGGVGPFHGIRVKSLERSSRARGVRTLATFLETLGEIPDGFVVTLPKVTSVDQVEAMVLVAERLEPTAGSLVFEIQIETPQCVLGPDGTALVARMIHAARGRCTALHYGTYDYSAYLGVAAAHQSLDHAVADHAKAVMQAAAAGTGVRLSDGSTNVLPVGDDVAIRDAWTLHLRLVTRSLERGFYQGWDLHPAQLPTRYAATFRFFRSGLAQAAERRGNVQDEPATVRALAGFLLRGLDCGALTADEVVAATDHEPEALAVLAGRTP